MGHQQSSFSYLVLHDWSPLARYVSWAFHPGRILSTEEKCSGWLIYPNLLRYTFSTSSAGTGLHLLCLPHRISAASFYSFWSNSFWIQQSFAVNLSSSYHQRVFLSFALWTLPLALQRPMSSRQVASSSSTESLWHVPSTRLHRSW